MAEHHAAGEEAVLPDDGPRDAARPMPAGPGWSEEDRLRALRDYAVLDTPPEPAFDDAARLAATLCDAPIALVSLVDEHRQWFKAEIGLGRRETPLDASICAHAIVQGGVLVVPDAARDPRFAANPLVTGRPFLRFYAGAPLETAAGLPIGSLCVLDVVARPHGLSGPQRHALAALARQVVAQLDLRRALAARRAAEAGLRESEARFRTLADTQPQLAFATDADGRNTYASTRFQAFTGLSGEALRGDGWLAVLHPEDRPRAVAAWRRSVALRGPCEAEYRLRRADGAWRWFLAHANPVVREDGAVSGWSGSCTDITAIVAAREAAARQEQALERLVAERTAERDRTWRLSRDMLCVADLSGRLLDVNPAWSAVLGHAEDALLRAPPRAFVHPDDLPATEAEWERVRAGQPSDRFENRWRHADGGWHWLSWRVTVEDGRAYAAVRDITQRKGREEALRRTGKLEAIGQLTGGVAHDFNNVLQVVSANLELIRPAVRAAGAPTERRLGTALEGVRRGAALTRQLLAFARRQPLEPRVIAPASLLHATADMLRRTLGETIAVELEVEPGLWNTLADPDQLENAILNLAVNARDAMPGGGRLLLRAGNATLDERFAAAQPESEPGDYACLAVTDTGEGMAPEVLAHAFEPFFSTKPEGQGTGLGLSQVYGFVRQSGGFARIHSRPGVGTTVRLYLPRDDRAAEGASPPPAAAVGGGETVLVVEDDERVRAAAVEMLRSLGYRALPAADAAEALAALQDGAPVDLVFTDVVLPGPLTAAEMARRARALRPGVAILFTSGYAGGGADGAAPGGWAGAGTRLLGKPYARDELARELRAAIEAARPIGVRAPSGPRRVLLVDDEPLIRLTAGAAIAEAGHAVVEAATAAAALDALRTDAAIDLLLTDLGLPDMDGRALVDRARALRPGIAVVVATGHGPDAAVDGAVFLSKPFNAAALLAAVGTAG